MSGLIFPSYASRSACRALCGWKSDGALYAAIPCLATLAYSELIAADLILLGRCQGIQDLRERSVSKPKSLGTKRWITQQTLINEGDEWTRGAFMIQCLTLRRRKKPFARGQ